MPCSAFADKSHVPQGPELDAVLGLSAPLWTQMKDELAALFPPLAEEWTFAGKAHGWSLRLRHAKRAVCYLTPLEGTFRVSFVLGEKAVRAAGVAGLGEHVLATIESARRYVEGRVVPLEIRGAPDVESVITLARVKMAN